jgi:hypothetical protein
MTDDLVPQDPLQGAPEFDGRIDSLEARLAKVEAETAAKGLSAEDEYNRLLHRETAQRIRMRYAAVTIATIVIIVMISFAYCVLDMYFVGPFVMVDPLIAVALFVAPIVSVSAVTIMLLVGAFRRFKDDDIEQVNAQAVIEAGKMAISN